jgi:hypothetical protein
MVLFTSPITYMNTTESIGFKVAVHRQDYTPHPNNEGYFGEVGQSIDFAVNEARFNWLMSLFYILEEIYPTRKTLRKL